MVSSPGVTRSLLSQSFFDGEITVEVEIYRIANVDGWTLELIDEDGSSTIWQDIFASDAEALSEFFDGLASLGLAKLIDPDEDDFATVH
jgi:hypothetical protein